MDADQDAQSDIRLGKAIVRSIAVGLPVALVGLTLAIWLITGNDLGDCFATAALPGVLMGVFGGGFVGMVRGSASE